MRTIVATICLLPVLALADPDLAKIQAVDPEKKAAALSALATDLPALLAAFQAAHETSETAKLARDGALAEVRAAGASASDAQLEALYLAEQTLKAADAARSTTYLAHRDAEAAQVAALRTLEADRATQDAPTP